MVWCFPPSMVKYVVKPNSQQNKNPCKLSVYKDFLVGVTGFEPAASWSRTKRSTELSHTPKTYPIQLICSPPKGECRAPLTLVEITDLASPSLGCFICHRQRSLARRSCLQLPRTEPHPENLFCLSIVCMSHKTP